MFEIGQQVVCIDDRWDPQGRAVHETFPVKGGVYTIREMSTAYDGRLALRFEEIVNPIIDPELHAEFVVIQPTRRKLSMQARMFLERFEAEVAHIHNIWDRAIAEPARKLRA